MSSPDSVDKAPRLSRRLMQTLVLISQISVAFATLAYGVSQYFLYRQQLSQHLQSLAEISSVNATRALADEDPATATGFSMHSVQSMR